MSRKKNYTFSTCNGKAIVHSGHYVQTYTRAELETVLETATGENKWAAECALATLNMASKQEPVVPTAEPAKQMGLFG